MVNYKPEFGNKTGRSENVTVTNCILSSRSACIRVGYGTHPVRNVVFSNIVMYESNRGIGIFARNDGDIENIQFSNIIINTRIYSGHWWGKGEPVHISAISETENGKPGRISHIRLSDIMAFSETGVVIYGTPGSIVSDVAISDMSLNISKGKHAFDYGGNFDLRPAWPMDKAVFKHDIPGIYAGYTDGLKISGLTLSWGDSLPDFYTSGIQVENFSNLMLEDMNVGKAHASPAFPDILLVNGRSVIVRDCYSGNRQAEISKSNVN
jgi:polygalacturonase